MMTRSVKERIYGIDLIKILACMGVVSLHTLHGSKGVVNLVITMLATLCIPLFFMVSGYLMGKRSKLDYRYALKKAATILAVCLCWEALHAAAHFAVYREVRDFLKSWAMDFFQQGLFYHFWYMGGLILVYLLMPVMDRLWSRSKKAYRNVLLALAFLNIGLDAAAVFHGEYFILAIPQNLRIHFWMLYAMLGCWIAREPEWIAAVCCRFKRWMLVPLLTLMVVWLHWVGSARFGYTAIEAFYGSLPVQLSALAVFLSMLGVNCASRIEPHIALLSSLTMGIYIMHPFVLAVFNKFVPAFTQGSAVMNLLFWLVTTAACAAATMVVQKLPVLNRLLKL